MIYLFIKTPFQAPLDRPGDPGHYHRLQGHRPVHHQARQAAGLLQRRADKNLCRPRVDRRCDAAQETVQGRGQRFQRLMLYFDF